MTNHPPLQKITSIMVTGTINGCKPTVLVHKTITKIDRTTYYLTILLKQPDINSSGRTILSEKVPKKNRGESAADPNIYIRRR